MTEIKTLQEKILKLKTEKNAIILVHNYQRPEIQDIADYIGDSLGLSIKAQSTDAKIIVFCGVDFMAQTASILNPDKLVLLPNLRANCPMAAMIDVEGLLMMKNEYPNAVVVSYVNTTAEVKAESDYCCTSANALKVCSVIPEKEIIFTPDTNLGLYIQQKLPDKQLHFWPGYCPTHQRYILAEDVKRLKIKYQDAMVIAHPECTMDVLELADKITSTEGMVNFVRETNHNTKRFIICTERELVYRLKKEFPDREFLLPSNPVCPTMKQITLECVYNSLVYLRYEIKVPENIRLKALVPIKKMIEIGR